MPWTLDIRERERLPAGVEAVFINRAHTYPDLALPINSAQARVLNAFDGKRSVDEVVRSAAEAHGADRTRMFIERLWNYDQIVFDASGLR